MSREVIAIHRQENKQTKNIKKAVERHERLLLEVICKIKPKPTGTNLIFNRCPLFVSFCLISGLSCVWDFFHYCFNGSVKSFIPVEHLSILVNNIVYYLVVIRVDYQ